MAKKDHNIVLEKATILGDEHRLLREWTRLSKAFESQAKNGEPLVDLKRDHKVNWTQVARSLDWMEPDGRAETGALISKISGKLRAISQHQAIDSDSDDHRAREWSRRMPTRMD